MNKIAKLILPITILIMAMTIVPVYADTIWVDPYTAGYPDPIMLSSPATFEVYDNSKTDYYPHVLLVITPECYNGISGDITVTWTGDSFTKAKTDFIFAENAEGNKIPPGGKHDKAYTVASCADHLGVSGSDVYYVYEPFLANPIDSTPQEFTVTITSTDTRMLVYAIGKTENSPAADYDNCVPPSRVGFVVPEPATIALMGSLFAAFGLFALAKRRKTATGITTPIP